MHQTNDIHDGNMDIENDVDLPMETGQDTPSGRESEDNDSDNRMYGAGMTTGGGFTPQPDTAGY